MSNDTTQDLIVPVPDDYEALLSDVRGIIAGARQQAVAAVNSAMVEAYWRIGERIVLAEQKGAERAGYGEQLLVRLGSALAHEFGRGFSERSLRNMRQFYQAYQIRSELRTELSWTHYRTLMRLPAEIRDFYERLAISNRWSSTQLEHEIGRRLHERIAMPGKPEELLATLPMPRPEALTYEEAFKDPYILDFLGLKGAYTERDLESALIANMERFLLELGAGFMFVGRQQRITIGGEDFHVDLVLYHRRLRCIVLVELKMGNFKPADMGQMRLYLEWFKRYDKEPGEADPVGLILVSSGNQQVVEMMVSDPNQRIQVSQYLTTSDQQAIREHLARMAAARQRLTEGAGAGEQDNSVE